MSRRPADVVDLNDRRRRCPRRRVIAQITRRPGTRPMWPASTPTPAGAELVDQAHLADSVVVDIRTAHRRRHQPWPAGHRCTVSYLVTAPVVTSWRTYETTAADLAAVLWIFADANKPLGWDDALDKINPLAGIPTDGRRREHKIWNNRETCLYRVVVDAHQWGLLVEVIPSDEDQPTLAAITPAGFAWLHPDAS